MSTTDRVGLGLSSDSRPAPDSRQAPLVGLAGLLLLAAGCWPMQHQAIPLWAVAALATGAAIWLARALGDPPADAAPAAGDEQRRPLRLLAFASALALAAAVWRFGAAGEFRAATVLPWLGGIAFWFRAWWPGRRAHAPAAPGQGADASRRTVLLFLAIFAVGVFFAFHRLANTPGNPTSDHAETLLDVQDVLRGERPVFFERNTGREPLKFYWLALLVTAGLPANYLTLKVATACLGLLAIPAMFLLGRELGGPRLGLLAAALVSFSKWHVAMERVGLRFTHGVFPIAFVLWALCRYMVRRDRASALWAGLGIGAGLYGYIPFRIVPLLVPLALGLTMLDRGRTRRRRSIAADGLLIAATAAIVFLPLLRFMVARPDLFWYRVATRAAGVERPVAAHPLGVFADNVVRMAGAFHWRGTETVVNAVRLDPFLDPMTGGLMIAGLIVAGTWIARGSRRWLFLVLSLPVLTLPSTLSIAFPIENPSINRSVTAIPVVMLLAALPLARLIARAGRGLARQIAEAGAVACLALAAWQSYVRYFVDFDRQYPYVVQDSLSIARAMDAFRARGVPLYNIYLISFPDWVDARNLAFESGDGDWFLSNNIEPRENVPEIADRPLVFIYHPGDPRGEELGRQLPGEHRSHPGVVPGREFETLLVE